MFAVISMRDCFRLADGRIRRGGWRCSSSGGEDEFCSLFFRLLNDTHGELSLLQTELKLLLLFVTFLLFDNGETIMKRCATCITSRKCAVTFPSGSSSSSCARGSSSGGGGGGSECSWPEHELVFRHGEGQKILSAMRIAVRWTFKRSIVTVRKGQTRMTKIVRARQCRG